MIKKRYLCAAVSVETIIPVHLFSPRQGGPCGHGSTRGSYRKGPFHAADSSGFSAVRLAHLLWEQGVEGSNPLTPTEKQNPPQQLFTIAAADFLMDADQAERKVYLFDFRRLQLLQSIWQFSMVVLPPSLHGVIWSPSISVMS